MSAAVVPPVGNHKLRFSTEKWSILSALIRWRTECKISHVEYITSDGWTLGARFSLRGKIANWMLKYFDITIHSWIGLDGVQRRPPSSTRKQSNVIEVTFPKIELAYQWLWVKRLNWPYDLQGILGIATARGGASKTDEFCSRAITDSILATSDWFPLHMSSQAVTPRDMLAVFNI